MHSRGVCLASVNLQKRPPFHITHVSTRRHSGRLLNLEQLAKSTGVKRTMKYETSEGKGNFTPTFRCPLCSLAEEQIWAASLRGAPRRDGSIRPQPTVLSTWLPAAC